MSCVVGIDPGFDGAIAVLPVHLFGASELEPISSPSWTVMPTISVRTTKREIDVSEFADMARRWNSAINHVFIEKVHAMPKQGVVSTFAFGVGFGELLGVLSALRLPFTLVSPQTWQKEMLRDMPRSGNPKGASLLVAKRLWPTFDFKATSRAKKLHSGIVDAMLIAEYGRRRLCS